MAQFCDFPTVDIFCFVNATHKSRRNVWQSSKNTQRNWRSQNMYYPWNFRKFSIEKSNQGTLCLHEYQHELIYVMFKFMTSEGSVHTTFFKKPKSNLKIGSFDFAILFKHAMFYLKVASCAISTMTHYLFPKYLMCYIYFIHFSGSCSTLMKNFPLHFLKSVSCKYPHKGKSQPSAFYI